MLYLFWCANEHTQFRIPEFESLAEVLSIPLTWVFKSSDHPWVILDLAGGEEEAARLLTRSLSIKFCVELWAQGEGYSQFHTNLKQSSFVTTSGTKWFGEHVSFKVHIESFNKKLTGEDKLGRIESLSYLPLQGPVKLSSPDVVFSYLEFHGFDQNNLPEEPLNVMFGRLVGEGQRDKIRKLDIKKRKFIGNTTMDPQLALLMANLAQVRPGSTVLDPFVGTGSLLVAAAEFGGFVVGSDIDYLTLHARTRPSRVGQKKRAEDESFVANFEQYDLTDQYLGVIASDFSLCPWRDVAWLDAIITDPPYGIREGTSRVGSEKDYSSTSIPTELLSQHYPQKVAYSLEHLLTDLLNFAARALVPGGRLVYWLPVIRQQYSASSCPAHPALALVSDTEQVLSSNTSRRLLVMERRRGVAAGAGQATVSSHLASFKEHRRKWLTESYVPCKPINRRGNLMCKTRTGIVPPNVRTLFTLVSRINFIFR